MEAHQKNWLEFFEHSEQQRDARLRLIRELPAEQGVKDLLTALDALSDVDRSTVRYPDGTVELSVPISVIAWQLRRSENTTKKYIDLAALTPYLSVSGSKHRSHTYLVCWLAIVDRQSGNGTHAGGCRNAAIENTRTTGRGSIGKPAGGQWLPAEGVKRGSAGGQLPPDCPPAKPGIKTRVFYSDVSNKPGSEPGIPGGSVRGGQLPITPLIPSSPPTIIGYDDDGKPIWRNGSVAWWRWWREQIEQRNLRDPADVDELFALGVASGLYPASTAHRRQVFAQAVVDVRKAKRPGALFRENVAWRRWYATDDVDDEVQRLLKAVDADGDELLSATRPAPAAVAAADDDTVAEPFRHDLCEGVDESRLNQMAKLQQWAAQR